MARNSFASTDSTMASIDSEKYPETAVIDLDNKDPNAFEVDVIDDTPEDDRDRPNAKRYTADDDEDLSGLAAKTQKRIQRLKFETHSERRERERAERERDEAIEALRAAREERDSLSRRLETGGQALASSMIAEREAKINDATRRLEQAHADGDSAGIAKATADLTTASSELAQIKSRAPRPPAEGERREAEPRREERQTEQRPQLSPDVARWVDHNRSWFNRDSKKTDFAVGLHHLLKSEGINPGSPEYTRELDKRMKQSYPDHDPLDFIEEEPDRGKQREPRRSYGGEPTGRMQESRETSNPRKVTLTSSELAIAKRLGVTAQAYAAEKLKRKAREKGAGA